MTEKCGESGAHKIGKTCIMWTDYDGLLTLGFQFRFIIFILFIKVRSAFSWKNRYNFLQRNTVVNKFILLWMNSILLNPEESRKEECGGDYDEKERNATSLLSWAGWELTTASQKKYITHKLTLAQSGICRAIFSAWKKPVRKLLECFKQCVLWYQAGNSQVEHIVATDIM